MTNFLFKVLPEALSFQDISQEIIHWNYSDLEGEGYYCKSTSSKYGHVKIKFSKGENDGVAIHWNESAFIPTEFRSSILNVLRFFISYMEGLKGEPVSLKIEILDGSYHPVDSNAVSFELVTVYSIHDCFGKPKREITQQDRKRILMIKDNFK